MAVLSKRLRCCWSRGAAATRALGSHGRVVGRCLPLLWHKASREGRSPDKHGVPLTSGGVLTHGDNNRVMELARDL